MLSVLIVRRSFNSPDKMHTCILFPAWAIILLNGTNAENFQHCMSIKSRSHMGITFQVFIDNSKRVLIGYGCLSEWLIFLIRRREEEWSEGGWKSFELIIISGSLWKSHVRKFHPRDLKWFYIYKKSSSPGCKSRCLAPRALSIF